MQVRMKLYLEELTLLERRRPVEARREVPSLAELARAAGIHKGTLSRWGTGEIRSINLDVMQRIVDELRRRGFDPAPQDIFELAPAEGTPSAS